MTHRAGFDCGQHVYGQPEKPALTEYCYASVNFARMYSETRALAGFFKPMC
jgi:hypothetical protein